VLWGERLKLLGRKRKLRIRHGVGGRLELDSITNPNALTWKLMHVGGMSDSEYATRIRASSIGKVCVRELLLGWRNDLNRKERLSLPQRVTFDIGNAVHYFLQNSPGDTYFGERRIGWWECTACGHRRFGRPPKNKCKKCRAYKKAIVYREHEILMDSPWRASGHIDMLLEVAKGRFRVADFKTMAADRFKDLKRPVGDHILQVVAYLMLLEHDTDGLPVKVDTDRAFLMYISKGHSVKELPIKTFVVERAEIFEKVVVDKFESFTRGFHDSSYLPDVSQECSDSNFTCWTAKSCAAVGLCRQLV